MINKVCEELVSRVDGATGPGGFLKAYKAESPDQLFFRDQKFLSKFHDLSEKEKPNVPGYHYYKKIQTFIENHCDIGMKYLEFVKDSCISKSVARCEFCESKGWRSTPMERVPQPYPDYDQLPDYHYERYQKSKDREGVREVDDFNPRKQLKSLFDLNKISLSQTDEIKPFCDKYLVEEPKLLAALNHLHVLKIKKDKRQQQRKDKVQLVKVMSYDEIDWYQHYENNTISKLPVACLNMYIRQNKLEHLMKLNKKEKSKKVLHHIAFNRLKNSGSKGKHFCCV